MAEESILYSSVREAMLNAKIIENYPEHQRGPCCLLCGQTLSGRYLHVVCTTSLEVAIIITVYEPKLPKWITPFQRREQKMKCSIKGCTGEYEQKAIVHTLQHDNEVFVFEHVPAEVCTVCGDTILKPETIQRLEILLKKNKKPEKFAPLYEYG